MQSGSRIFGQVESVNHLLMAMEFVSVPSCVIASIAGINVKSGRMFVDLMVEEKTRLGRTVFTHLASVGSGKCCGDDGGRG